MVTPADRKKVGAPLCDVFDNGLCFIAFDNNFLNFNSALFRVFYPFSLQAPAKLIPTIPRCASSSFDWTTRQSVVLLRDPCPTLLGGLLQANPRRYERETDSTQEPRSQSTDPRGETHCKNRCRLIPRSELEALIERYYPNVGNCRQPVGLYVMLRIYFLRHCLNLLGPGAEDALYKSVVLRRFTGVDLDRAAAPDETTILNFHHLLEYMS